MNRPGSPAKSALRATIATIALALCACKPAAPSEPAAPPAREPAQPRADAPLYRPALADSLARMQTAYERSLAGEDSGAPTALREPRRMDLSTIVPASVDVVAARAGDQQWVVAAIERDRVAIGLEGAERIYQLREQAQQPLGAMDLAAIVGVLHYYPYTVFNGQRWSETPLYSTSRGLGAGATPTLAPRPQGGRDLTFSFHIPDGRSGAGGHLAHIRVTDSGMLIDQAPNPEVR